MAFGMRCHDLGGKQTFDQLIDKLTEHKINNVQLAFKKSIIDIDFTTGHYNPGLGHFIGKRLAENNIHVSVLGCYINPTTPDEKKGKQKLKDL